MPLNWKDEPIPSKADKATDILGFKEIGGIGQLIYYPFRFKDYRLGDDKGDYCAFPICRPAENVPEGEFATTPYNDYESLRDTLIDIIPDFNMRLKVNPQSGKIDFSTDVKSVFDIA